MGFVQARKLRKLQEQARTLIERRIARRKLEITRLEKLQWDLQHQDWGEREDNEYEHSSDTTQGI